MCNSDSNCFVVGLCHVPCPNSCVRIPSDGSSDIDFCSRRKEPKAGAASLLSKRPEVILGIDKPNRKTSQPGNVVYTLPNMDEAILASELAYHN